MSGAEGNLRSVLAKGKNRENLSLKELVRCLEYPGAPDPLMIAAGGHQAP
jgi:hypothetical protein